MAVLVWLTTSRGLSRSTFPQCTNFWPTSMSKASVRSVTYAWRTMNSGSITVTSPNRRSTAVSGTASCAPIWVGAAPAAAREQAARVERDILKRAAADHAASDGDTAWVPLP